MNRPLPTSVTNKESSALTSLKLSFSNLHTFRTANKKTRRRKYTSAANANIGVGPLQMFIEESHSCYLEYSVTIEMAIGDINRDAILHSPEDKERNAMSFFKHDLLEAFYTHYYYFGEPIDKSREDAAVVAAERAERLRRLEEERERKKGGKNKKKKKRRHQLSPVGVTAADLGDSVGGEISTDVSAEIVAFDEQHSKEVALHDLHNDRVDYDETAATTEGIRSMLSTPLEAMDRPKFQVAPNITKYIWRTKVLDTLRKRDDLTEMPFSRSGRGTRDKLVINRKYLLDKGNDDSTSVFLNTFVELDRGIQMPRISRFNLYRHTALVEEKHIARLEERVKATEDESK